MAIPQQNGPLDPGKLEENQGKVWNESPVPSPGIGIDPQSDFLSTNEPPPPYCSDQIGADVVPGPIVVIAQPTCSTVDAELEACRRNKSKRYRHDSTCSMVETETHCLLCCCFGPRCSGGGGCCSGGCNCGGCTCSGGGGGGGDGKAGLILLVVLVLFLGLFLLYFAYKTRKNNPESRKWLWFLVSGIIFTIGIPAAGITLLVIHWNDIN